jgi:hypothetical protein
MSILFSTFCDVFMNFSAKIIARIKAKYNFAIYMSWAYKKCQNLLLYVARKL